MIEIEIAIPVDIGEVRARAAVCNGDRRCGHPCHGYAMRLRKTEDLPLRWGCDGWCPRSRGTGFNCARG